MGIGQTRGRLPADGHRLLRAHQHPSVEEVLERSAREQFGHEVGDALLFAPVVDLEDGRVVQCRHGSSLGPESLEEGLVLSERRLQDLDGDLPLERRVLGPVDDRRCPDAQHRLKAIAATEDASDVVRGRGHE